MYKEVLKNVIVIPCFNEAVRLKTSEIAELLRDESITILFVNDGSTDNTLALLVALQADYEQGNRQRIEVLSFAENRGKAEAVRQGLLRALSMQAETFAYLDADFSTPASEMLRLLEVFSAQPDKHVMLASRWLRLGADIERTLWRHYCGRIFATLASVVLDLKVYDTQCGAKLFRANDALARAIDRPFNSRWAFDVELIGRLRKQIGITPFCEEPLNHWKDISGSKMGLISMCQATLELIVIWRKLRQP